MKVGFSGMTHLGRTLMEATRLRGFEASSLADGNYDLLLVTEDVLDHDKLDIVDNHMQFAVTGHSDDIPVVLVSQVPPGYTRKWAAKRRNVFYQADTIIMSCALRRAVFPERFVIGCAEPEQPLPQTYLEYLAAFECPVVLMDYESAEFTKLAVNFYLAAQVNATNLLSEAAQVAGVEWASVMEGTRYDKRIGAYLQPGTTNQHLNRDVVTIERLIGGAENATQP